MEIYIVDGVEIDISTFTSEEKASFLEKYKDAVKKSSEPVKTTPVAMDATAGEEKASDGDSSSVDISLDSSIEDINKNKENAEEAFKRKQFELKQVDYEEGVELSSSLDNVQKKEEQLRKFFQGTKRVQSRTGNQPAYDVGGQFTPDYESTEQEKLDFPEYFNEDGTLKTETEIKIIEADLEKQEKGLIENPLYKTLKDIDQKYDSAVMAKLETESARIAYDATVVNESLKEIDSISKDLFGRGIADLNSYKFTTQEELDKANRLIKDAGANYKILQSFQTDVNSLSTFYNNIENKNAQAEYAEGFKGVMNEIRLGASNGRLNTALISYDLGRPVNMNDVEDTKEIISTIVKETKFQKGLLNSKEFAAFNAAGNSDEFLSTEQFNLLMSSAAGPEIMASLVGNSLSQMVTTGRYIIPGAIAAGSTKGFVLGSSFGPAGSGLGTLGGGLAGLNIGMALTNGAVEYGNSIFEAIREKGYDLENPEDVERALSDTEVWAEGRKIGISRAIPIMLVDYLGGKFAGDLVSPLAGTATRAGAIIAESTILQPGIEAIGEAAAQTSAYVVAGKEINLNEITMEALGGLGSKSPQLAGKVWYNSTNSYKKSLAKKLADNLDFAVDQNSSERINSWADQMLSDKLIDQDTHVKIKNNATVASEANTAFDNMRGEMSITERALDTAKNGRKNKQIKKRLSNLIEEQRDLNRSKEDIKKNGGDASVLNKALKQISDELQVIQETGSIEVDDSFKTKNDLQTLAYRQFELGKKILGQDGSGLTLQEVENLDPENTKGISEDALKQLRSGAVAVNTGDKMILNLNALKNARANYLKTGDASAYTSFSHEILHTVLANKFDTKEIQEISTNLQDYINEEFEKGSGVISGRVKSRIDKRMARYSDRTAAVQAEEYLNVLSDEMASGAIQWDNQNKGFWNNIAEKIKDTLYAFGLTEDEITSFDITDGKSAFDFLKTYSKSFNKGQIKSRNLKSVSSESKSSMQLNALAAEAKQSGNLESSDLKNQYELLALEALGFQKGKGTVNREEAISFVNQYFPGIIRRYDPNKEFSTFVYSNIKPKRQKFYQEEIGDKAQTTSIDDERASQIADDSEPTPTQSDAKVRKAKPFSNLKNLTEDVLVVLNSKINNVLSSIPLTKVSAEVVIDKIKNLVEKNLWKDIKEGMGTISKPGGVVTVSPEYKAYHDSNYKELVEAIPLSSAKRKYKSLFKIEKIGREKDKKVNPKTGKVTYPGTGIFNVTVPKKGAFGSYHTVQKPGMGINTLIERQTSLAKEVARGLAAGIVDTYIEENKTTLTKDMKVNEAIALENLFDQIKTSIDPNSNEQRKFDVVKATIPLVSSLNKAEIDALSLDMLDSVKSGIAPEAAAVLISSKYNVPEEKLQGVVGLINKVLAPFSLQINPEAFKQIADQEGVNKDQQLDYDSDWNGFLERTGLTKYGSYEYNTKDIKLRNENKGKFEKSLVSYLEKLPDEVLDNQMFLSSFQNSTATSSFYANAKEIKNVIKKVKESRKISPKSSGINWNKVNFSPEVANKLAKLSNENLKNPMSNKALVSAYKKILAAHKIDIKETKKALKYVLKSINTFYNKNNKSVEAGKFITTWMRMQTNFGGGIFRGSAQFESMSLTPSKTTFKTGSPALRNYVADQFGLTSDEVKYLNGSTGKLSVAKQKGIQKALEAKYENVTKLKKDIKELMAVPKEFHGEHDIALMLFTTNVFKAMNESNFDSKYDDIARYYSQTLLNENDRMLIDSAWGRTGNSPDYYFGMMPEIRFTEVIPGIAKDIFMFEYGTTLDQVILNKLASKEVLNNKDLVKKLVTALKASISPKSLQVVKDNKSKVISNPSIRETYNTLISETATEVYNETDNSNSQATAVELTTQLENSQEVKEVQQQNTEILNTSNTTKSSIPLSTNTIINDLKELDNQVEQQRSEIKASIPLNLSDELNKVLQETKGVNEKYTYSKAKAQALGQRIGKWKFFIPPSAEDFKGLIYSFLAKGKIGDKQLKMFKDNLFRPFAKAIGNINNLKQSITNDFQALKKQYPAIKKLLSKEIPTGGFTYDSAVRVYLWTNSGVEIPGLSKADQKELYNEVKNNPELKAFADKLNLVPKITSEWLSPDADWQVGNIASDINDITNKVSRKKFLADWIENKNEMFSDKNLNKIEALYGSNFREALEDVLYRMEYGTNRSQGGGRLVNGFMDWINNSVGAIMFFNTRSALLQQLSMTNFINWSDNSIIAAASAFANQKQFWTDFSKLWNSDYLKQRRSGLQSDINEAEIASAVANSKNKAKALISYLLKKGFLPTQLADSFAIATGGASMYRNRIKTYIKQGMSKADAETKAFTDFQEIAEETQQSSRPDLISQQQAGPLGRVILAFQNTPMQYMRLSKKALLDLINRRGDDKTNISKIIYYTAIQNLIFTSLQNALFASLLGDEDDDKITDKRIRAANSSADTILKGMGIGGAAVSTIKNILIRFSTEENKPKPNHTYTILEAINFSPPVGSKLRKFYSALQSYTFDKDKMYEEGLSLDNPAYIASGKVVSAFTNIPLDRLFIKLNNLKAANNSDLENWQRVARFLGYSEWDINPPAKKNKKKYSKRPKFKSTSKRGSKSKRARI
jgi:hypothetical protein